MFLCVIFIAAILNLLNKIIITILDVSFSVIASSINTFSTCGSTISVTQHVRMNKDEGDEHLDAKTDPFSLKLRQWWFDDDFGKI